MIRVIQINGVGDDIDLNICVSTIYTPVCGVVG